MQLSQIKIKNYIILYYITLYKEKNRFLASPLKKRDFGQFFSFFQLYPQNKFVYDINILLVSLKKL